MTRNKNLQVNISEELLTGLKLVAAEEGTNVSNIVRTGITLYLALTEYQREGKTLYFEDEATGEKVRLIIPGLVGPSIAAYSRRGAPAKTE